MSKNLVIVESPAKAKTIEKFLGPDFIVKSSIGHIRDMPKKGMGIDIENNFAPTYEVSVDKKKVVADLRRTIKMVDKVWLATDEDREGEAIAWHLRETLKLDVETPRIVFHEITKTAITNAIKNPRTVNQDLVDAQQARRILDRLVGFELSPVLWRKVSGAKSAGRVQSPVMRLVVDREREIKDFASQSSFKVSANLFTANDQELPVKLKQEFSQLSDAEAFANKVIEADLVVSDITTKPIIRSPKPPFITSTLQQEASQKLGFSVKQTMVLAQNLYRNGFITYMRTDSLNLSEDAISQATQIITKNYGADFSHPRRFKSKDSNAQEAHEAIRPTSFAQHTVSAEAKELKLYRLIYNRALASQMSEAKLQKTTVSIDISNTEEVFVAQGEVLMFDGFLKVYNFEQGEDSLLPVITQNEQLKLNSLLAKESFTRAKPRYTESSLVKKVEAMGIGRPSTFASMVSTVQDRGYVVKETREGVKRKYQSVEINSGVVTTQTKEENTGAEKNKLFPTDVAYLLTDFLVKHFSDIMDYDFTANVEKKLDEVALNNLPWQDVLSNFYQDFHPKIEAAMELSREETHQVRELGKDPKTGKPITVRFGRYGAFAQIGDKDDEEKPIFASLRGQLSIETITLDEAIELFKMPRTVGETKEHGVIKANYGRFGPYIQYGKKYVSLKDYSPEEVTLETALELIVIKEKADAERVIKTFEKSDIQVLNGRFGPYIWNGLKKGKGQKNITIKKVFGDKKEPIDLTLQECEDAISGKLKPKTKPKRKPKAKPKKKT
jgi:DNA topoisomerase-1